ncbi:MAG: response regulator [bacterium]|nr:response regulator [bacterium]
MKSAVILLADDDQEFREFMDDIIERIFPDKDIKVIHAATGKEAIDIYLKAIDEDTQLDVVITDYAMPGATGSEVIDTIIKKKPLPIIVVSAAQEAYSKDFIQEGAVYFLPKPFEIETVKQVITEALELNILPEDIKKAEEAIEKLKNLGL